jgi:ribosome-associated protein
MSKSKLKNSSELLFDTIFEAMHDKKAENILLLDLTEIKDANFDYFVIAHGNSTTQVNAIAEEVRRKVKTICRMNPAHAEGFQNSEWILLDYLEVVVHIFQYEIREHYQLENLWADAIITPIVEQPTTKKVIEKEIAKKGNVGSKHVLPQKEKSEKTAKKTNVGTLRATSKKETAKSNERKSTAARKSTAKPAIKSKSTTKSKSTVKKTKI